MTKKPTYNGHAPSSLATATASRLASLESIQIQQHEDIHGLKRSFEDFSSEVRQAISTISKPNFAIYIGVATLMLMGVPMIAALIYFTVVSTVSPLRERLGKFETEISSISDNQRDDFELLIRNDQALIDSGVKINDTNHALNSKKKAREK